MRRILKYFGVLFASLTIILLLAVFVLPKTGPGQSLIDSIARPRIAAIVQEQLDSEIDFDRIRGALPGELILSNVRLLQDNKVWFETSELHLVWKPFGLIKRDILIDKFSLTDSVFYRRPDLLPKEADENDSSSQSEFPLPSLKLSELSITNFSLREEVIGERYDLQLTGNVQTGGQRASGQLKLDTVSDSDTVRLVFDLDRDSLDLNGSVLGAPDGILSRLVQADGAIWLNLEGAGKLSDWNGIIETEIGQYGGMAGEIGGNLKNLQNADFSVSLAPGPLLPEIAHDIAGDTLFIRGQTSREGDDISLTVDQTEGRFGQLSGQINLTLGNELTVSPDIRGEITDVFAGQLGPEQLAAPFQVNAVLKNDTDDSWSVDGQLSSGLLQLSIADGRYGGGDLFTGLIDFETQSIPFENPRLDPLLDQGAKLSGNLTVTENMMISLQGIRGVLGQGDNRVTIRGGLKYNTEEQNIDTSLQLGMQPGASAQLLAPASFSSSLTLNAKIEGPPDNFMIRLTGDYPAGQMQDVAFSSGSLNMNFSGMPMKPSGTMRIAALDQSHNIDFSVLSRGSQITVNPLIFSTDSLTVSGQSSYRRDTGGLEANLSIEAPDGVQLFTGQRFAGVAEVTASREAEGEVSAFLTSPRLSYSNISLRQTELTVSGPLSGLQVDLKTQNSFINTIYLNRLMTNAILDLSQENILLTLRNVEIYVADDSEEERISLISPVTIAFGDSIRIGEMEFDWLKDGRVKMEALYSDARWLGEAALSDVSVPGLTAPLSASLRVDTSAETIADITAYSTVENEDSAERYTLSFDGQWDGRQIISAATFGPENKTPVAVLDLQYPLDLVRSRNGLSVNVPKRNVDGTLAIDGNIRPIYTLLPSLPPYLSGKLNGTVNLTGSSVTPGAEGNISLSEGRFEETSLGLTLTQLAGDIDFSYANDLAQAKLNISGAGAEGRPNSVKFSGTATRNAETTKLDSLLTLDNAAIISGPDIKVRTAADLKLSGELENLLLAGDINIEEITAGIPDGVTGGESDKVAGRPEFTPVNIVRTDGEIEEAPLPSTENIKPFAIALDLAISAPNKVYVRGRGLDTEWQVDLDVEGNTSAPLIDGDIRIRRGKLNFAGRTFDFDRGIVTFQPGSTSLGEVDARAVYAGSDVTAYVNVGGALTDPDISLSSDPTLPDENILALVLFGKQPTELSALESLQIANALRSLAGIGPSIGGGGNGLSAALGLDALSFGVDQETGEGVVAVGKYISDEIYVSARQTAGGTGSEVTVTYEVSDKVTLESRLQPDGTQDVSVKYKKDY